MRDSLWDYTEFDTDPDNADPFALNTINELLKALGYPPLIPAWDILELDLGAIYATPGSDGLKSTLILILQIADLFLP
jgi:hypothetical protein